MEIGFVVVVIVVIVVVVVVVVVAAVVVVVAVVTQNKFHPAQHAQTTAMLTALHSLSFQLLFCKCITLERTLGRP